MTGDRGKCRTYPLFPFDPNYGFEFYTSELDPGACLSAEAHPAGTQETLMVVAGQLTLDVEGESHLLGPGQAIRFRADEPHDYRNQGTGLAEFTMIVAYPRKG